MAEDGILSQFPEESTLLMCQDSKDQLQHPNNVMIFKRSKNANVVLIQANIVNGKINPDEPLLSFWLKIEPSYIKKRRRKGYKDDRASVNLIERNVAYGFSWRKGDKEGEYIVVFVAMPSYECILKLDSDGKPFLSSEIPLKKITVEDGKRVYGDYTGEWLDDAIFRDVYIDATENWIGYPTVNFVDVKYCTLDDRTAIETIQLTPSDVSSKPART